MGVIKCWQRVRSDEATTCFEPHWTRNHYTEWTNGGVVERHASPTSGVIWNVNCTFLIEKLSQSFPGSSDFLDESVYCR